MDSESHTVHNAGGDSHGNAKITDFFSTSLTEEDMAALDDDWDGEHEAKKPRLLM